MGWDKNLNFDEVEKLLKDEIIGLVNEKKFMEWKEKPITRNINLHLSYNSILYIQLHNGARISETIEGIIKFMDDGKREQRVKTKKRIKRIKNDKQKAFELLNTLKDTLGEELVEKIKKVQKEHTLNTLNNDKDIIVQGRAADRLIIIKKDIKKDYLNILKGRTPKQIQNGVCLFALNHHKINTHSLRYAFINQAGRDKIPSNIISSAIRHSSTETITNYTREQAGDDLIREMNK